MSLIQQLTLLREPTADELKGIEMSMFDDEFLERLAILALNNPDMHLSHAVNKAKKEIRTRRWREQQLSLLSSNS